MRIFRTIIAATLAALLAAAPAIADSRLPGPRGMTGPQGPQGARGSAVLSGPSAPDSTIGINGDFYVDTTAQLLYGPKADGIWPGSPRVFTLGTPPLSGAAGGTGWANPFTIKLGGNLQFGAAYDVAFTATGATTLTLPTTGTLLTTNGNGSGVTVLATGASNSRSLAAVMADRLNVKDWAACDGTTDDTSALNAWLAAVVATKKTGVIVGTCVFMSALTPVSASGITIVGVGASSVLLYKGASAVPGDLVTFGDGTNVYVGLDLRNFTIGSTTVLTAGTAIRIKKFINVDVDVVANGPVGTGNGNLWDGLWFDQTSTVNLHSSRIYTQHQGVKANGGSELHLARAWIAGSKTPAAGNAVYIGGGYGGVYTEGLIQQHHDIGMLVDTAVSGTGNKQFFFAPYSSFDSNVTASVKFDDSSVDTLSKVIYAESWFATSSAGDGFVLANWTGGDFRSSAGVFKNHSGSGIVVNDATVTVVLGKTVELADNGAYGLTASSPIAVESMAVPINNGAGKYGSNVSPRNSVTGSLAIAQNPTLGWAIDGSTNTVALASGASVALAGGTGLALVTNLADGTVGLYSVGGAIVTTVSVAGSWVSSTTTPAAGKVSIAFDGSTSYRIYSNYGSTQSFAVVLFRSKAGI